MEGTRKLNLTWIWCKSFRNQKTNKEVNKTKMQGNKMAMFT